MAAIHCSRLFLGICIISAVFQVNCNDDEVDECTEESKRLEHCSIELMTSIKKSGIHLTSNECRYIKTTIRCIEDILNDCEGLTTTVPLPVAIIKKAVNYECALKSEEEE